jgi:hypothetical protein
MLKLIKLSRLTTIILAIQSLLSAPLTVIALPDDPPPAKYTIRPNKIQAGKSLNVKITTDTGDLSKAELEPPPEDSGVTFETVSGETFRHPDSKTLVVQISVDENADLGTVPLVLIQKADDKTKVLAVLDLEVTEFRPRKISRGPTPDDIDFEVDAMWNVLPYKVVKANFGRRAADSFYAIEVYLGNNSGFDIQIVGVGFDSTLGVRTADKDGKPLAFLTDDNGKLVLDEYGNKFIEAVNANGERILQDGKPTYRVLKKYQVPTSDHRLVRGTIEMDQLYGSRALTLNLVGGFGTFVSGFIPFFHRSNPKANFSTFSSIFNGQLKEGFGIAAPDLTVSQLNRLENLVLHDGLTVLNNSQAKTIVFFPRHVVALDKQEREIIDKGVSMWPLLEKLGELIIVGKPIITYKNREIVATKPQASPPPSPTELKVGAPTITDFALTAGPPPVGNAPDKGVTISGTNFVNVTDVKIGGVSAPFTVNTATQLTATVPQNAVTGPITVTTASGTTPPSQKTFIAQPKITGIAPKSGAPNTPVAITGLNLENATSVTFGGVAGTFILPKSKTILNVSVPEQAVSGTVSVTTPGGTANSPDTEKFVAQPILDDLKTKQAGATDSITITGKNLDNAEVLFGNVSAQVLENDAVHVKVEVPPNAVTDVITVKTPVGKVTTEKFTFIPKPIVTGFKLNGAAEAATASGKADDTLVITGQNLTGATEVKFGDKKVTPTNVTATQLTVKVPTGLPAGTVTIKITTPGGEASTDKFTVAP